MRAAEPGAARLLRRRADARDARAAAWSAFCAFARVTARCTARPSRAPWRARGDDAREATQLVCRPQRARRARHGGRPDAQRSESRVLAWARSRSSELMAVLPFAGLSHLVSTVSGTVRPEITLRTLLEHTLPPGSVTGTPKARVLAAIAALETAPRGVYTGCVGFVDRAGGCSLGGRDSHGRRRRRRGRLLCRRRHRRRQRSRSARPTRPSSRRSCSCERSRPSA